MRFLTVFLIGLLGLSVLAGCSGDAEPVEVSGPWPGPTETVPGEFYGDPIPGSGETFTKQRGTIYRGTFSDFSDDRVNGSNESVINSDLSKVGDTFVGEVWGTATIVNDGGTWEGTWEGTSTFTEEKPGHFHDLDFTLIGTGDYEGLRFVCHAEGIAYPWSMTGTIEPVE